MSADGHALDDLLDGIAELDAAFGDYAEAEEYYTGNAPEVFASHRIRRQLARTGERYKFALAATPVRVLANRVTLTGVTTGNQAADDTIQAVRDDNLMGIIEADAHLMTFKFGDAYLFAWPTLDTNDQASGVRVLLNSPETVRAIYDDDDPQRLLYVIKSWVEKRHGAQVRRADLYYDETADTDNTKRRARIERYTTRPDMARDGSRAEAWEPYLDGDQEEWLIEHDYGMPWVHFRNGLPYGAPEHLAAYGSQDAISKMLITQLSTTDSHGFPQRYRLIDDKATLDDNNDDPDWEDDTHANDTTQLSGGVSSGMRGGPGTMQDFTGTKSVGQFDAADPKVFTDPTDLYVRLMSQLTDTPLYDFDPSKEQPSGIARKRAEAPLISKASNRQLYLTAAWRHFWMRVLGILGHQATTVTVSWAPAFTIDDTEGWQVLAAKRQMGVPLEQLLVEAGYTAEQAKEWADKAATQPQDQQGKPGQQPTVKASAAQADLDWGLFGAGSKADSTGGNA